MNCQEVREYFSRFLEGEISNEERALVGAHLSTCKSCRLELEALKKTIHAVQSVPSDKPPPGFANQVMARIRYEGSRSSLFERLFSPLSMKVPAYAVTLLLIAGIYYYMNPELESKKEAERLADVGVAGNKESFSANQSDQESKPVLQESPAPAAPPPQRRFKKKAAAKPAPVEKQETAQTAGVLKEQAEAPPAPAPSPVAKESESPLQEAPSSLLSVFSSSTDALEIMKRKNEAYLSKDQTSTVTLRLFTKEGKEKRISTKRYWKNYAGMDGLAAKTLIFAEYPPDAKGTGFLLWDYAEPGKDNSLWLYLPAVRQVRQISPRGQDENFMGSDLTLSDMGQRRLEEDYHHLLREEACGDAEGDCFVVESVAKNKTGVYSKRIQWIAKKYFIVMKIEYYDLKGDLLKTQKIEWQELSSYKVFKTVEVVNVQTQHKTIFEISDVRINTGLKDDLFTERTLKTGVR